MEYTLKVGPQGHVYFPKKIRLLFGDTMKLFPDEVAGVIYPDAADLSTVIASLKVIISHLQLKATILNKKDGVPKK